MALPPSVPFEEEMKNPKIWYLDHNYLESMFHMFKKVNGESSNFMVNGSLMLHAAECLNDHVQGSL
jgi:hypothetical protein